MNCNITRREFIRNAVMLAGAGRIYGALVGGDEV